MTLNWKNIVTRAAWAFLAGVIGAAALITATPTTLVDLKGAGLVLLGGGVTGLVSFVKTVITEFVAPTITLRATEVSTVPAEAIISAPVDTATT